MMIPSCQRLGSDALGPQIAKYSNLKGPKLQGVCQNISTIKLLGLCLVQIASIVLKDEINGFVKYITFNAGFNALVQNRKYSI